MGFVKLNAIVAPALVLSAALLVSTSLVAAADSDVAATVNGHTITELDIEIARDDFANELQQVPADKQRAALIDILVDTYLMADEARAAGLDKTKEFDASMALLRERALRNKFFRKEIDTIVSEEAIKARYEEEIAKLPKAEETRARHILVKEEDEAKAVIKELGDGADFAELAQEKSTGPSGPSGGDLGFFGPGQMVPEFDAAVTALEVGAVSEEPVQTQFGWHVIKVEERRERPAPPLAQMAPQLRNAMIGDYFSSKIEALRGDATIDIVEQADAADETTTKPAE